MTYFFSNVKKNAQSDLCYADIHELVSGHARQKNKPANKRVCLTMSTIGMLQRLRLSVFHLSFT